MTIKSVLITGCSAGGIGFALAEVFQKRNVQVFASARTISKMSALANLPNVTLLALDVTSSSSIAAAVEMISAKTGGTLDYLVNNSGVQIISPLLDMDIADGKTIFDVNFWAVLAVIQAFAPLVLAAKGTIANVGSISGILHSPWMGVYNASKAALFMLDETLRLELMPFGVKVLTIITGAIDTNIMKNSPPVKLPSNSKYTAIEERINARAKGDDVSGKTKVEDFAETVVNDILSGASGKVWRGSMASMTRYSSAVLPTSVLDNALMKGTGLDVLTRNA